MPIRTTKTIYSNTKIIIDGKIKREDSKQNNLIDKTPHIIHRPDNINID